MAPSLVLAEFAEHNTVRGAGSCQLCRSNAELLGGTSSPQAPSSPGALAKHHLLPTSLLPEGLLITPPS